MLIALLALSIAIHPAQAICTEPGKRLWNLKSTIPKPSSIAKAKRIPLADLMQLPYPNPLPKRSLDTRRRLALVPNPHNLKEGDMVRTSGWLRLIATEDNDCEYHLQLTDSRTSTRSLIVEIPKDDTISIRSKFVRGKAAVARAFIRDSVNSGAEPPEGGEKLNQPVYVDVVGQLFLDSAHGINDARGKAGMPATTLWEIHPVLAIKSARAP